MPLGSLNEALPGAWTRGEIAIVGLARSGRAAAELLGRAGARVYASDGETSDAVARAARALEPLGVTVQSGGHDLARIAAISGREPDELVDRQAVARLAAQGLVSQEGTRLRATGAGMLLLDAILAELVRL